MPGKVGAPPGGRVHWLLWHLSKEFKRAYRLRFDYEYHNYHFARYAARTPIDEYIVIRTSRRCFRCMYFNYDNDYFEYFSEPTSRQLAEHMERLYRKIRRAERMAGERE